MLHPQRGRATYRARETFVFLPCSPAVAIAAWCLQQQHIGAPISALAPCTLRNRMPQSLSQTLVRAAQSLVVPRGRVAQSLVKAGAIPCNATQGRLAQSLVMPQGRLAQSLVMPQGRLAPSLHNYHKGQALQALTLRWSPGPQSASPCNRNEAHFCGSSDVQRCPASKPRLASWESPSAWSAWPSLLAAASRLAASAKRALAASALGFLAASASRRLLASSCRPPPPHGGWEGTTTRGGARAADASQSPLAPRPRNGIRRSRLVHASESGLSRCVHATA